MNQMVSIPPLQAILFQSPTHRRISQVPGPIPTDIGTVKARRKQGSSQPGRTQLKHEDDQVTNLKGKQYALHCQVCLSNNTTDVLAPSSSYVALHQNRQQVMKAHHCDHVESNGARHVGNIILLCHYHHLEFGDAVSRSEVIQSLCRAQDQNMTFISNDGVSKIISGKRATVHPPQRQVPVSIFFTKEHAHYWLDKAHEEGFL